GEGGQRRAEACRPPEARRDDAHDDRRAEFSRSPSEPRRRARQLQGLIMRTIQTTAGTNIELDGDMLAVMEAIRRDLSRRKTLDYTYEDVRQEIEHVIGQMNEEERRAYLREAL